MAELPACACVRGLPPYDRLTAIYQAAAELSGDDTLPDVTCVAGVPPFQRFAYIYAALRVIAGDDTLPSMECVEGETPSGQVARIYQAARIYANDGDLLTYECVRSLTLWQQWMEIYRALYMAAGSPDTLTNPLCINTTFDVLSEIFCGLVYLIENANPIVLSAIVSDIDASTVSITFNQAVEGGTGFSFLVNGANRDFSFTSGLGTSVYEYTLDAPQITEGDVVLLAYTPGDIVSVATGNPLEAFTDFPVTNPFDEFVYLRPGGVDTYLRPGGVDTYIRP